MAFSPRARESLIHAGRPFTETTVRTGRDVVTQASVVIAPSMNIGTLEYRLMPFLLDDIEVKAHSSPQNVDTIGIATLLRHEAVCFSWRESLLYLGNLGPCEGGDEPFQAHFGAGFLINMEPRTDGMPPTLGIVDTGADHTPCPPEVMATRFAFGEGPSMALQCHRGTVHSIIIGMDTLAKFAAFGWEVAPLRLYFVPYDSAKDR